VVLRITLSWHHIDARRIVSFTDKKKVTVEAGWCDDKPSLEVICNRRELEWKKLSLKHERNPPEPPLFPISNHVIERLVLDADVTVPVWKRTRDQQIGVFLQLLRGGLWCKDDAP
jgi:hypothetical protein